jgi:hypothetical protein
VIVVQCQMSNFLALSWREHVTCDESLGHIILIPSQPLFALTP